MRFVALHVPLILGVKVLHNSYNTVTRGLPDTYVHPQPSGRLPVLQLLDVHCSLTCTRE